MRYYFTILLAVISFSVWGYGIGDWQHVTPGGNVMGDAGSGTCLTTPNTQQGISGINRWYFFRYFIIGEVGNKYFIVDEKNEKVLFYKEKVEWINYLQDNGLSPSIWTRWYTDNWVDGDYLLIWLVFLFFISIPFVLFFLFAFYKAIAKERFGIARPYTIFVMTTLIIIGGTLMLDFYPQSI